MRICLWCGYDLTGLPDEHACPECGLDYDPEASAIELRPARKFAGLIWILLMSSFLGLIFLGGDLSGLSLVLVVFIVIVLGALTYWVDKDIRQRLVLNQHGLHLVSPGPQVKSLRWREICTIRQSWTGDLLLKGATGCTLMRVPFSRFGSSRFIRSAITLIEETKRAYQCQALVA